MIYLLYIMSLTQQYYEMKLKKAQHEWKKVYNTLFADIIVVAYYLEKLQLIKVGLINSFIYV